MKKTSITASSITEGQRKQFKRFVEDAADRALAEAGLDKDGIQRVIEKGDDLQATIVAKLKELSEYAEEEVPSNNGYLSGYRPNRKESLDVIIADFEGQVKKLDALFNCGTRFNPDWIIRAQALCPEWVEKFFAQFDWRRMFPTYNETVQQALDLLKQDRNGMFFNHREGKIGEQYLRQSARSVRFWQQLAEQQQGHDILIVPAQFGLRHRDRGVRSARAVFTADEFGLGAFANITMVLTHPDRLKNYDDLWIDCAGDEYAPGAVGDFSRAPCLYFRGDEVRFGALSVDLARVSYGSSSAFLPQQLSIES